MKMLGAKLSVAHRRAVGKYCWENKIGVFGESDAKRREYRLRGNKTQMDNQIGFFDPKKRREWAVMGGIKSFSSPKSIFAYWASAAGRKERGSRGGKAHRGKKTMYKPGEHTFIRVQPKDIKKLQSLGYILGSPVSPNKGRIFGPSIRRKKVSDGSTTYDSVHEAALKHGVSSATIIYRCKSKKSSWKYVF